MSHSINTSEQLNATLGRAVAEKIEVTQQVKKLAAFSLNRTFINVIIKFNYFVMSQVSDSIPSYTSPL